MGSPETQRLLLPLYASIFLVSTALGTAMTLLPVYAESLGASILELGYMGTAAAAGYTVMTLVSGALLDRFEKLRLYLLFNLVITGTLALLYFSRSLDGIFAARTLVGLAAGCFWTTAGAVTAELAPRDELARAIGRYNLSWMIGFVVGPFFGGFVSDAFGYPALWVSLVALMVGGDAVVWLGLVPRVRLVGGSGGLLFDFETVRRLGYAYLAMIPYALGLGLYFAIIPGYLAEAGVSASVIGVLIAASGAAKGVGFLFSERIVGLGPWRGLLTGAVLLSVSLLWIGYSGSGWAYLLPLILYGASSGIIEPIVLDYVARNSPRESLGATMGVYEGIYGASTCVSPLAAGIIGASHPPATIYVVLSAVSLLIIPAARKLRG